MKILLLILLSAVSLNANAGFVDELVSMSYRRNVDCSVRDRGWEEHGSHSSCSSCLAKHGHCVEVCTETYYKCKATGKDNYFDRENTYEAVGEDRYDAEREALRKCDRDGSKDCSVDSCDTESDVVSRDEC